MTQNMLSKNFFKGLIYLKWHNYFLVTVEDESKTGINHYKGINIIE